LALVLALVVASPLLAKDEHKKKGEPKPPPCPAAQRVDSMVKGLTLTADQTTKLDALKKEFGPKLSASIKKSDVLTPDQKKARAEAAKAAKAAGKTGKEIHAAADAAAPITDAQKAQQADAQKQVKVLAKDLGEKVMAVLTPAQKEQLKPKKADAKKAECKTAACTKADAKKAECTKADAKKADVKKTDAAATPAAK
jgi:Spy/CpxP family protein refolding chaperone